MKNDLKLKTMLSVFEDALNESCLDYDFDMLLDNNDKIKFKENIKEIIDDYFRLE
jgi:GTPase Era involved in 16S rRNA processing